MTERLLLEALDLANAGRKTEARRILREVLRHNLTNETAWLWFSDCCDTPEERLQALHSCLRHNPNAHRARAALARLRIAARAAERYQTQVPVTGSAEWLLTEGSNVFTVSPEALSQEEFAAIEARVKSNLEIRPNLSQLKVQRSRSRANSSNDWNELARIIGKRTPRQRIRQTQPVRVAARKKQKILVAAVAVLFLVLLLVAAAGVLSLLVW